MKGYTPRGSIQGTQTAIAAVHDYYRKTQAVLPSSQCPHNKPDSKSFATEDEKPAIYIDRKRLAGFDLIEKYVA
jgi:hypothetical protein